MFEPFFFHDSQLFGCYHAANDFNASRLVVVCPPLFDEYRRAYRAMHELGLNCAENGVHTLRFDYPGTGDSQQDLREIDIAQWLQSIENTIEEGLSISGATEVCLLGIRFGATLAAQVKHPQLMKYVFWDPVISGKDYRQWLCRVDENLQRQYQEIARQHNYPLQDLTYENFDLSADLQTGMDALSIDPGITASTATHVILSTATPATEALFPDCENIDIGYDWPMYQIGVIKNKPALEAMIKAVKSS